MNKKTFELLGRKFILKPLVIGQVHQMQKKCGINMTKLSGGADSVSEMLNDVSKVATFIAVIVQEEDVQLQDKNVDELAKFFLWNTDMEAMKGIMQDFFGVMNSQGKDTSSSESSESQSEAVTPLV